MLCVKIGRMDSLSNFPKYARDVIRKPSNKIEFKRYELYIQKRNAQIWQKTGSKKAVCPKYGGEGDDFRAIISWKKGIYDS